LDRPAGSGPQPCSPGKDRDTNQELGDAGPGHQTHFTTPKDTGNGPTPT
jgi:hypothetical protein